MRASRILQHRPDRAILALAQLCEERKDETLGPSPPQPRSAFAPPRLNSIPPQTPYTVGSSPMRPNEISVPAPEDIASPGKSQAASPMSPTPSSPSDSPGQPPIPKDGTLRLPVDKLDHMAPIRGKWASPPPPEATAEDHAAFEDGLGQSLALATASTGPRPREPSYASSNASETHTDDERQSIAESDDVRSVKSFLEEGAVHYSRDLRERERHLASVHAQQQSLKQRLPQQPGVDSPDASLSGVLPMNSRLEGGVDVKMISRLRGRPAARSVQPPSVGQASGGRATPGDQNEGFTPPPRMDSHTPRRSMSFPVRNINRFSLPAVPMAGFPNPLAAAYQSRMSPTAGHTAPRYFLEAQAQAQAQAQTQANVYYEAVPPQERMYRAMAAYSPHMQFASPQPLFDQMSHLYSTASSSMSRSQSRSRSRSRSPSSALDAPIMIRRVSASGELAEEPVAGPSRLPADRPAPPSPSAQLEPGCGQRVYSHQHSHSSTTIIAPTPPATVHHFSVNVPAPAVLPPSGATLGPRHSPQLHSQSRSRSPPYLPTQRNPPHPYVFHQPQYVSPRMGASNLPPRLRADRERSFGQAGHSPLLAHAGHTPLPDSRSLASSPDMRPVVPSPDMRQQLRSEAQLRPASPFASRSHSSGSASPPMSCTSSSHYAGSSPLSTSPPSPAQSETKRGVAVVSPLRSPIPLLDPDVDGGVPGLVRAPRGLGLVDVPEKEGSGTPVPVMVVPSPAPMPASASPAPPAFSPVLPAPVNHEPAAIESEEPQDADEEIKVEPPSPSPTPEVKVTGSSPVVEKGITTSVNVPEEAAAAVKVDLSAPVEVEQESPAGQ